MAVVIIELDSDGVTHQDLDLILAGGTVMEATAVLNRHWQDYSALALVDYPHLPDVQMDYVGDDTASMLLLTVMYANLSCTVLESRLKNQHCVVNYHFSNTLYMKCFD